MHPATAQLPGLDVHIVELSVADVRAWQLSKEAGDVVDPVHWIVFDDCSLSDLARMSDVTAEQLEAYGPTELAKVRAKAKAINPHFFKLREMLAGVSRRLKAEAESLGSMPQ